MKHADESVFRVTPARVVALGAVLAIFLAVKIMFSSGEAHHARTRVTELMRNMTGANNSELAMQRWFGGSLPRDPDTADALIQQHDEWRISHDLKPVKTFEVTDAKETGVVDNFGAAEVVVSGTVNGKPFRMKVQRGRPVAWVD